MANLEPTHTKARIYLRGTGHQTEQRALADAFARGWQKKGFDAICMTTEMDESLVVEVVGIRHLIHESLVPALKESFPGAFVTLEAVCAMRLPTVTKSPY